MTSVTNRSISPRPRFRFRLRSLATPSVCSVALILGASRLARAQRATPGSAAPSGITTRGDSITIQLIDVDVRAAIEALGQYLDRPVVFGTVPSGRVTVQTPKPVRRQDVLRLLRSTLESQSLELVADTMGSYSVRAKPVAVSPPAVSSMSPALSPQPQTQLFVIQLSHARATDVAATINALYGRASAFGELGASHPASTLSQELGQTQTATSGAMQGTMQGAPPNGWNGAGSASGTHEGTLSTDAIIIPDQSTNTLLVRATQADYDVITAAVKQIDVRPLQVVIEMLVVEVEHDREFSLGLNAVLPPQTLHHPNVTVSGSQTGLGLGDLVIQVMGRGGIHDLDLTLSTAASRGDVSIVSRPAIVAANNEQAQILVGSQQPFVEVSRSLPTDAASRDQVVEYKDVGTKLSVRPTISHDGYVMLEVTQEISQATDQVQFNAPVISTRSVQTRLLLKDGQTVVIGGLRNGQRQASRRGVPLLSSIPILGGLFGSVSRSSTATELFLFITPRVLHDDADMQTVTKPLQDHAAVMSKQP